MFTEMEAQYLAALVDNSIRQAELNKVSAACFIRANKDNKNFPASITVPQAMQGFSEVQLTLEGIRTKIKSAYHV
jgi:hypothetical protein